MQFDPGTGQNGFALCRGSRDKFKSDGPTAIRDNRPRIKSYKFKSDLPTDPGTSVPGRRSCRDRHHVSGQPRPVPDRRWMEMSASISSTGYRVACTVSASYGQGLGEAGQIRGADRGTNAVPGRLSRDPFVSKCDRVTHVIHGFNTCITWVNPCIT